MPSLRVERPVVRSFKLPWVERCAAWVREGGHAILWESDARARLVIPVPKKGDDHDLGYWAILDLGKWRWHVPREGALAGLGTLRLPPDCLDIVRGWITRDSIHPGPRRTMRLDCLACGACCRDNAVILTKVDEERFADGGRPELAKEPYARRRKDGKLVLRLAESGDCQQLGRDNKCAIYTVRPDACRDFPAGSECCLYAREEELGIVDGATE
jgi:hypothetical protein